MRFSYNWLQSYFAKNLPKPQELAELLTMHSFEVEEVIKNGKDWMLEIDILPNRAHDCLSYMGLAREISALTNQKFKDSKDIQYTKHPAYRQAGKIQNTKLLNIDIQDSSLVQRYIAYVVNGVSVKESPKWMRDRLMSMGQKGINNVVDITNYIMWDSGQPLHAFDFGKINPPAGGGKMTIRESREGEKITTLDGETHSLSHSDIIIEDGEDESGRIIDLAGIKGGGNTQIGKNSKTIIFQAAVFDPLRIRKTTQRLNFSTDAAKRYIHGFDAHTAQSAIEQAFSLLLETNPDAKITQAIDIYPSPEKAKKITLDVNYVNNLLGTYMSGREVRQFLERLGFGISAGNLQVGSFRLRVTVPTYRLDVETPEDLIEEVGRMYGYENINARKPAGILSSPHRNFWAFWRLRAREVLGGFGFSEVYNYSLMPKPPKLDEKADLVGVENPVSDEFRYMRPLLMFGALKNISGNSRYFDSIKLFEFGNVFYKDAGEVQETENVIIALNDPDGFYLAKGYIDEFLKSLGVTNFYYSPMKEGDEHGMFLHGGRRANIILGDKFFGFVGEADPDIASYYGIKGRVVVAELDFDRIVEEAEEEHEYERPSKYPEVVRDISILVPSDVMAADVLNAINSVSGPLLRDIDLFDTFSDQEDIKSFAFHLLFQSDERTLKSEEVDKIMNKITKTLKDNFWEVR